MDDAAGGDGVSEVDFSDHDKAVAWLETQNVEARYTLCSRAALRSFGSFSPLSGIKFERLTLNSFRAAITSSACGKGAEFEVDVLRSAAAAARTAAGITGRSTASRKVDEAAYYTARSAGSAAVAGISTSSAIRAIQYSVDRRVSNVEAASSLDEYGSSPLWPEESMLGYIAENHSLFLQKLNSSRTTWGFWHDWYLAMWEGRFTDWDLAIEVAKIPDGIWNEGAKAVAVEIDKIRASRLDAALPQAETVEFDSATQRFSARPIPVEKTDLIGATLQQVQDSLEDVLASPSNGLGNSSREVRVIERTLRKYGNNPQQIEMGFVSAHAGMTRQIIVEELPASEENLALQSALEEGAVAIRATHPDVAENRAILTKRKFEELSQEQKEVLAGALPVLSAISDDALSDDWEHDIPALINTSVGPLPTGAHALPGADEATRIFSRAAKISILLRTSQVIHAIDQGAPYKAARILTTIGALVTIGLALLTLI